MLTYIALLRGINVSGQKKVPMNELKTVLEEAGFRDVVTYIQSGNFLFRHKKSAESKLAISVADAIKKHFGFDVDVQVFTPSALEATIVNNPFTVEDGYDPTRLYLTLLAEEPSADRLAKLQELSFPPEEFRVDGRTIYFYSPLGYGNAKMNNYFFEQKLKVSATTRNWKTVTTLVKMAESYA